MNIDIKSTNLDFTPVIKKYIEMKIGALGKFLKKIDLEGVVEVRVEIARTTKHHKRGDVFKAECNLKLPHEILRAEHEDSDVRVCIDRIRDELQDEIKKYKEKSRPQDSSGQEKLRKLRGK